VNAQQKSLDAWLIYKCSGCDATWKLEIFSRVNPNAIPPDLLDGLHKNDPALARQYASDVSLIKRNGAETGPPEIEISGEDVDLSQPARIHINAELPLAIKTEAVLRKKLGLSRSEFDRKLAGERLVCLSGHNLKKCKLTGGIIVELK